MLVITRVILILDIQLIYVIKALILPPGGLLFLLFLGLIWWRKNVNSLMILVSFVGGVWYLLSTWAVSGLLMDLLENYPALSDRDIANSQAQAIVVLAGGGRNAPEYGGVRSVADYSLVRMRYGAYLHRKTGLPVLLTGGDPLQRGIVEAELMASVMENEWSVAVKWQENNSRNTAENAQLAAKILHQENINHILLVTHAWHMARAVRLFEQQNLQVTPAPTSFEGTRYAGDGWALINFLPNARAFLASYHALHEWVGQWWYRLRY